MNNGDRKYFEDRFSKVEHKLERMHDDVLTLKLQRDFIWKGVCIIAGFISLTISTIVGILWR